MSAHDAAFFGEVDASIRQVCIHTTSLESSWSGRSGIGLVKRNDINFPSRAAKKTFPKQPNTSPPGTPRSSEHQASRVSWFGMEDAQSATPGDAWQAWMEQSADLSECDSDELPPAEILRQAQELGVKASMMSAAQSDLVHVQLPGVVHFALPEVPSLLPSGTGPPEEARATDELLDMLQAQSAAQSVEGNTRNRLILLRKNPTALNTSSATRDAEIQSRLQQLKLSQPGETHTLLVRDSGTAQDRPSGTDAPGNTSTGASIAKNKEPWPPVPIMPSGTETKGNAAASSDIEVFLAELQEGMSNQHMDRPAPSITASSGLDDLEDQHVQQLIERALLSDELSVSPARTGELDNRLREQWHEQWDAPADQQVSSCMALNVSGAEAQGDCSMHGSTEAGQACVSDTISQDSMQLADSGGISEGNEGDVAFSTSEMQRPEVKEALVLAAKLQTSLSLALDDSRRPQWLGAIAIRTAEKGLKALQGGDLKLACAMNRTCFSAAEEADLKPGDRTKVDAFYMGLQHHQAVVAVEGLKGKSKSLSQPSQMQSPISGFPDTSHCSSG